MFRLTVFVLFFVVSFSVLSGRSLHVAPSGGAGTGAVEDPVSLQEAVARARVDPEIRFLEVHAGVYSLDATLDLRAIVRAAGNRLTIRSAGGTAILRGGRSLGGYWTVPDEGDPVVAMMPEKAREAVRMVRLPEAGVEEFGRLVQRGFNERRTAPGELFVDGRRMPLAGFPNLGTTKPNHHEPTGIESGFAKYQQISGSRIILAPEIHARWGSLEGRDVWAHGYWGTDWADAHLPIKRNINGRLEMAARPATGMSANGAVRIYNLPEELDAPGEWFLDRSSGNLYFWPRDEADLDSATFSTLDGPLMRMEHSRFIRFEGMVFEVARGDLVEVSASADIQFRQCVFRGSGLRGLVLSGMRNRVGDSLFEGIGEAAIVLGGGDRKTLRPSGSLVHNTVIREFSELYLTYAPGVLLRGTGHTVAYNRITDAPHEAIQVQGALHRIWRNEIARVCTFTDDAGAIYSGRDWLAWGNRIEENYIHQIRTGRSGPDWVHGIYLDDFASGFLVRRNVFEDIDAYAVNAGGGRFNHIEDNLFINLRGGHLNDNRGAKWIVTNSGDSWNMFEGISKVDRHSDPWRSAFPGLAKVPSHLEGAMEFVYPDGSRFVGNAAVGVDHMAREKDWMPANPGVFAHYLALDLANHPVDLPGALPLSSLAPRGDARIRRPQQDAILPLGLMGPRTSSWLSDTDPRPGVAAAFTWSTHPVYAGDRVQLDASTAWSATSDPLVAVEWFVDDVAMGQGRVVDWQPQKTGPHRIRLLVRGASGATDSVEHLLSVQPDDARPLPWNGEVVALPGRVEAEHFDENRFSDYNAGNQGGHLRDTAVDIGLHEGAYYVGWTQPGEWLEYSLRAGPAVYDVYVRAGSRTDGAGFALRWNGELAAAILLPNVGNNRNFGRHHVGRITTPASGRGVLRASLMGKDFNIDHFEFVERERLDPIEPEPPVEVPHVPETPAPENPPESQEPSGPAHPEPAEPAEPGPSPMPGDDPGDGAEEAPGAPDAPDPEKPDPEVGVPAEPQPEPEPQPSPPRANPAPEPVPAPTPEPPPVGHPSTPGHPESGCCTPPPTASFQASVEAGLREYRSINGLAEARSEFSPVSIPLNFHWINARSSPPRIDTDELSDIVAQVSDGFAPQNTRFFVNSSRTVSAPEWSNHEHGSAEASAMKQALAVAPATSINVYICDQPRDTNGHPVSGYATAPWDYAEDDPMNGIVLSERDFSAHTLMHMLGHYFGLLRSPGGGDGFTGQQHARAADLAALYRPALQRSEFLWAHAPWSGSKGWRFSDWLKGWIDTTHVDWIYHNEHGWLFSGFAAHRNGWFYTFDLGWVYIGEFYPWLFLQAEQEWWLYLVQPGRERWFHRAIEDVWIVR